MRLPPILLLPLLLSADPVPLEFPGARTEVYREVEGAALRVHLFGEPVAGLRKPAIVFFFGGGWRTGSPAQFVPQARHFAGRGMIAMTADYRVASRQGVKPVDCVADARACLLWIDAHAARLGIDPRRVAAAGGSAGGHLAAATGTFAIPPGEAAPDALILFNPALVLTSWEDQDLGGFGSRMTPEQLGTDPLAFSPIHHIGTRTPPTLILHGTADETVPIATAETFDAALKRRGQFSRLVSYQGAGHGWFNRGAGYAETLADADSFLVRLGWLPEP